jgi:hypothetical protein
MTTPIDPLTVIYHFQRLEWMLHAKEQSTGKAINYWQRKIDEERGDFESLLWRKAQSALDSGRHGRQQQGIAILGQIRVPEESYPDCGHCF